MRSVLIAVIVLATAAGAGVLAVRAAVPADVAARADVQVLVVGRHVAERIANEPAGPAREALVRTLASELQLDLAVVDPSGTVTASGGAPVAPLAPLEVATVTAGQVQRVGDSWPPRVAAPLVSGDASAGYVIAQLASAAPPSRVLPLALALGLALVAAVACALLARSARGPINRLEGALEALETLPRGEPLDVGADGMLRGAADRFNRILERVSTAAERDEELLAIVARELKRPVHDARETLRKMAAGEPFARGPVELDEELELLETLLEDVLTTARLKLDRVILRRRRTRLGVLVQDAASKVASSNPVTFDLASDLAEVDVDGRLLSRAVAEIVKNAAQHSDAGAAIAVAARTEGAKIAVSVTDGGSGVLAEERDRLFEPFFRSRAIKRHLAGRTGLGLTLAKRVIEAHGGTISVTSQAGVGTAVTFTLPVATGEPPEDRPSLDLSRGTAA